MVKGNFSSGRAFGSGYGWAYGILMVSCLLSLIGGCGKSKELPLKGPPGPGMHNEHRAQKWGIRVEMIALTAAGRMVDFRFRVLDTNKAAPLFDRKIKAYLIHQATQRTLEVPTTAKVGPLRSAGTPKQGKIYWMFFGNPGVVKPGDKVTVIIGEFMAEDLVVR